MSYGLPESTIVDTIVPKKMFIEELEGNRRMKDNFTRNVELVKWHAKLAPSTINVSDGEKVHEITVFITPLKSININNDLFTFIDSRLPRHTIFILEYNSEASLLVNYKEKIAGNSDNQYRIIKTYTSPWEDAESVKITISGLSMDSLYDNIVRQIAGEQITFSDQKLRDAVDKTMQAESAKREIEALKRRIAKEVQPDKKFNLHKQLVELNKNFNRIYVEENK